MFDDDSNIIYRSVDLSNVSHEQNNINMNAYSTNSNSYSLYEDYNYKKEIADKISTRYDEVYKSNEVSIAEQSKSLSQHSNVPYLPPIYESNWSFQIKLIEPYDLLLTIETILDVDILPLYKDMIESIDYETDVSNFCIRGIVYSKRDSVNFQICLFYNINNYIIEVQRRQGDSFLFRDLYNYIYESIKLSNKYSDIIKLNGTSPQNFMINPNASLDKPCHSPKQNLLYSKFTPIGMTSSPMPYDGTTIDALLESCSSTFFDLRAESLKCLLMTSFSARHQNGIVQDIERINKVVSLVEETICNDQWSMDHETIRCAISIISNISKNSVELIASRFELIDGVLSWLQRSESRDVKRQCGNILVFISKAQPTLLHSRINSNGISLSSIIGRESRDIILRNSLNQLLNF